ncbi:unnamed protein product, partial [Pylaiella littoralis]
VGEYLRQRAWVRLPRPDPGAERARRGVPIRARSPKAQEQDLRWKQKYTTFRLFVDETGMEEPISSHPDIPKQPHNFRRCVSREPGLYLGRS